MTDSHTLLYRCPGEYLPMNFAEVEATKFDVCVVGSGASGGIAAKELCEQGAKVCVLEIGEWKDPARDFQSHVLPFELPITARVFSGSIWWMKSDCRLCRSYWVTGCAQLRYRKEMASEERGRLQDGCC